MAEVLRAVDLCRHYTVRQGFMQAPAVVRALNGVSFKLQAGETLAVVGESGCGKSTLARQLTLIETPTSGELWLDGKQVDPGQKADAAPATQCANCFPEPVWFAQSPQNHPPDAG
ncbi:MAG: ATP-binding cassette domain-containing protein [Thiolinea sp.]